MKSRPSPSWSLASALAAALLVAAMGVPAIAAPLDHRLQVEGVLRTTGGGPVANGDYALVFRLYADADALVATWKEVQIAVPVVSGHFYVLLGNAELGQALPAAFFAQNPHAAISLQVFNDPELPRVGLARVPYAMHALSADALVGGLDGAQIKGGSVPGSAVDFAYAGSDAKGGPAIDVKCTGCVGKDDLAPGLLDAKAIAFADAGPGGSVQDALGPLYKALKASGLQVGIGKAPADLCALDLGSDGGDSCIDGVPALWTRIAGGDAEMNKLVRDGQLVYRSDNKTAWMRVGGLWRQLWFKALCGDGVVEGGEQCDNGVENGNAPDKCRLTCVLPKCGDQIVDKVEDCDDGNDVTTDICITCKAAFCGDGLVLTGVEECDNGGANADTADKCRTTCKQPVCGDKIVDTGEECDDGNDQANDGCAPGCKSEFKLDVTFLNCGKTGRTGPSQAQCDSAYAGGELAGTVTVQGGIQLWTVPASGTYRITTTGARSGHENNYPVSSAGRGIVLSGEFALVKGQVLKILVGQVGLNNNSSSSAGGGGTFVASSENKAIIVSGGGGGHEGNAGGDPKQDASATTAGNPGSGACQNWLGGTDGNGATQHDSGNAGGGGGGFDTNGAKASNTGGGGIAFVNGGEGGAGLYNNVDGGFGGGAGAWGNGGGAGGGGGYSGGGMGDNCGGANAGGGGSFNAGGNTKVLGYHTDHGKVRIERL